MAVQPIPNSASGVLGVLTPFAGPILYSMEELVAEGPSWNATSPIREKISGLTAWEKNRGTFAAMTLFSALIHATSAVACASMRNLSLIFAFSSGLSLITFAASTYLSMSAQNLRHQF